VSKAEKVRSASQIVQDRGERDAIASVDRELRSAMAEHDMDRVSELSERDVAGWNEADAGGSR
jgi:hypothetical protein